MEYTYFDFKAKTKKSNKLYEAAKIECEKRNLKLIAVIHNGGYYFTVKGKKI